MIDDNHDNVDDGDNHDNHDNDDVDGVGGGDWEEPAAGADVISLWDRAHKKCQRKNWKETQKPLWAWHVGAP